MQEQIKNVKNYHWDLCNLNEDLENKEKVIKTKKQLEELDDGTDVTIRILQ